MQQMTKDEAYKKFESLSFQIEGIKLAIQQQLNAIYDDEVFDYIVELSQKLNETYKMRKYILENYGEKG